MVESKDSDFSQMPFSDLTAQLRDLSRRIQSEVKDLDAEFIPRIAAHESEIERLTAELDHTCETVEELNSRIQKLASTAVQALDSGAQEVGKVRRRNRAELDDISARHQSTVERALSEQKRKFFAHELSE